MREPGYEIIGKRVIVKTCEAREHGDNDGCVCGLIGTTVIVGKRYQTPFVGTPSFHLEGSTKRIRESEVVVLRQET